MDKMLSIAARMGRVRMIRHFGQVSAIQAGLILAGGLSSHASLGDRVVLSKGSGASLGGEIIALHDHQVAILPEGPM